MWMTRSLPAPKELEIDEIALTQTFIKAFLDDVERLGSTTKYLAPKATEYMQPITTYIAQLIDQGFAYEVDGDVYFDVKKSPEYGILSNRQIDEQELGSRIAVNDKKRHPLDFTLWKKTTEGVKFSSPWGEGRPGWHTECAAMIDDIFGEKIDIHGGGADLVFPHHENEIAQANALHHHHLANIWMHNGHLQIDDSKMSKSEGTVIYVKDLTVDPMGFRLLTLGTYYRAPLMFNDETLNTYTNEWERIKRTYSQAFYALDLIEMLDSEAKNYPDIEILHDRFIDAMTDDFNTANALTHLYALVKLLNQKMREEDAFDIMLAAFNNLKIMFNILGLRISLKRLSKADRHMYHAWKDARKNRDFDRADQLREKLSERGILS